MSNKKLGDIGNPELVSYNPIFKKYIQGRLSSKEKQQFLTLLREKKLLDDSSKNMPLEYIFGKGMFMGNVFKCTQKTFIPRKDTEVLVKAAFNFIKTDKKNTIVFDIGTGTGNIAISLALKNKHMKVYSSDISREALEIAQENISYYNLSHRITLLQGEMFNPHKEHLNGVKADIVICNPPYIPTSKLQKLPPEIINYEPIHAFDGGPYGLNIFREIINKSPDYLKQGGVLLFEFGSGQDGFIKRLFDRNGKYSNIAFYDFDHKKRVVSAIYSNK